MGLDIYVNWGDRGDGGEWPEFPEDRKADQLTGFVSAPYAGYLRESWPSLAWVRQARTQFEAPDPYGFFAAWDGGNGDELPCTPESLPGVLAYRDEVLRPWLRDKATKERVYTTSREELTTFVKEGKISVLEQETVWQKLTGEFETFRGRVADVIGFLNFVELHKDEPNLTICFY